MKYNKKLEFANYTCRFGESLRLLDLFEEVVFPSFEELKHIRKIADRSEYFFLDTGLINIAKNGEMPIMAIAGKFVKNAKIKRDQVYRLGKGIVQDVKELETAPTALFVLLLDTHRLLYLKEVSGAPNLMTFYATSQKFLRECHKKYINNVYEQNSKDREKDDTVKKVTKKELVEKYPYPELRVTTLTDPTGLKEYINLFEKIDELKISLLLTNDEEINNDDFWKTIEKTNNRLGGKKASTRFTNRENGLNKDEVYVQSNSASELANSEIQINGLDTGGGILKGNNDDFQLSVDMPDVSRGVAQAASEMYQKFRDQVVAGNIKLPQISEATRNKILSIINVFL